MYNNFVFVNQYFVLKPLTSTFYTFVATMQTRRGRKLQLPARYCDSPAMGKDCEPGVMQSEPQLEGDKPTTPPTQTQAASEGYPVDVVVVQEDQIPFQPAGGEQNI